MIDTPTVEVVPAEQAQRARCEAQLVEKHSPVAELEDYLTKHDELMRRDWQEAQNLLKKVGQGIKYVAYRKKEPKTGAAFVIFIFTAALLSILTFLITFSFRGGV